MSSNAQRGKRKTTRRDQSPSPNPMEEILRRLCALEDRSRGHVETRATLAADVDPDHAVFLPDATPSTSASEVPTSQHELVSPAMGASLESPACNVGSTQPEDMMTHAAERLLAAITRAQVRSNHYFVSDFDPSVHDFDTWCVEVEKARILNRWDDGECLARVGHCLKGEARTWLSQWTSNIRLWSSFKLELSALCPRSVDVANILYDVMRTESDKYSTYAEYARKSLLKLRIVKGLSDGLLTAIIIRGITDPQIRAMATNAKLSTDSIVEFLSQASSNHQTLIVIIGGSILVFPTV